MKSKSAIQQNLRRLSAAATLEICIHQLLFALIVLPVVAVVLPAFFFALGLYMVMHLSPAIGRLAETFWIPLVLCCATSLMVFGVIVAGRAMKPSESRSNRKLRPVKGKAGEALKYAVNDLWKAAGMKVRHAPEVLVFSNLNVIASAVQFGREMSLHLSTGLWERIVQRDVVGRGVLAHEIAHLIRRDPQRFRALEGAASANQLISKALGCFVVSVSAVLLADAIVGDLSATGDSARLIPHFASALIFAALVCWAALLFGLAGRRYAAFIVALMEMRADLEADELMGGSEAFVDALAKDPDFREVSLAELRHSLTSPSLTHISMAERAALLARPDRLGTPKLRYFAISLLLAALVPLNPITPLIFGGVLDHLLVLVVNIAMQVATIGMIIVSADPKRVAVMPVRTIQIAIVLIFASILSQINLFVFGYLLFSVSVDVAAPGTLSDTPPTLSRFVSDAAITWQDLTGQFWVAAGGLGFVAAIVATAVALFGLSYAARKHSGGTVGVAFLPMLTAAAFTIFSGYDEFRDSLYAFYPLTLASSWFEGTEHMVWLRLSAPALGALLIFLVQAALLQCFARVFPKGG